MVQAIFVIWTGRELGSFHTDDTLGDFHYLFLKLKRVHQTCYVIFKLKETCCLLTNL